MSLIQTISCHVFQPLFLCPSFNIEVDFFKYSALTALKKIPSFPKKFLSNEDVSPT